MSRHKVLVIQPIHESGIDMLRARPDIEFEILEQPSEAEVIEKMHGVHAITVRTFVVNRAVVNASNELRVVSRHGVGYDAVDLAACGERNIPVTITPGANSTSVAEHAMYMVLALAKQCLVYDDGVRAGLFAATRNTLAASDVEDKHLLIVGFGRTGSRLAPRALAFGMKVSACDPYIDQDVIRAAGATPIGAIEEVLEDVDFVSVHCPLTPETDGLFGADEFARMKSSAILVNTARGGVYAEGALVEALQTGQIAAAGLDVFEGEPTPPSADHPFMSMRNVLLTPHSAGVSLEASVRTAQYTVQNVLDCLDGKLPDEVVVNRAHFAAV